MIRIPTLESLQQRVGQELAVGDWVTVDQPMIDKFAEATGDHQWIHLDAEKAAAGPFGTTIAHGFLTLSMLPVLASEVYRVDGVRMGINYGLDKVRFPATLPVGSKVRATVQLLVADDLGKGWLQLKNKVTIEREGHEKPVCVAESLTRLLI
jgi:acyl dehydratase